MNRTRYPMLAGACAVTLITGCATSPGTVGLDGAGTKVAGVYRVQEPAGTAAGQYAVGRMELAEGRVAAAISRFENALKLDPSYVEALNGLGVAYGQSGRYAEAVEVFRSALASGPAAAHVLNNLGYAQMKAGQLHEASVSLERSSALDPSNARTRENLRLLAQARESAALAGAAAPQAPVRSTASTAVAEAPVAEAPAAQAQGSSSGAVQPEGAPAELTMAPSPQPAPLDIAQADTAQPELTMAPARVLAASDDQSVQTRSVQTQAVHVPEIEVAARSATSAPADWNTALTAAAQAMAAAESEQSARNTSYEVVSARSNGSVLVRLAPNVYELRQRAAEPRIATAPSVPAPAPIPLAAIAGLEVSNGVGLPRLASRTARQLSRFGADVTRVSDYRSFAQRRTEIHYRTGHLAGARAVGERLPVEAKLVRAAQMPSGVNVRLVVGRDMVAGPVAQWHEGPQVARAEPDAGWRHL